MDGEREARKRETADVQMEKEKKDEHLKLLTMPRIMRRKQSNFNRFYSRNIKIFSVSKICVFDIF